MGKITEFKRVKCKKQLGVWYYKIEKAERFGVARLDGDLYHLYNDKKEYENTFGSYGDMKYFIEYGEVLA